MSNDRCTTRHGHLQCMYGRDVPHVNCEVEDPTRCSIALGPYRDRDRTVAYVRGAIDFSAGEQLDTIGTILGVERRRLDDCAYRAALSRALP